MRRCRTRRSAELSLPPRRVALAAIVPGLRIAAASLLLCLSVATSRAEGVAELCDRAALQAASETGVPADVLLAITRTETGRTRDGRMRPWPWTVNVEGTGRWFDTRAAALEHAARHRARGARSFDVGCFQINYRWHGQAFGTLDEMFDPLAGARYAARFLSELRAETGSWPAAAGAYHSRTPELAARYRARFERHLATLQEGPPPIPDARIPTRRPATPRDNRFPLLRAGPSAGLGSLVPLVAGAPLLPRSGG